MHLQEPQRLCLSQQRRRAKRRRKGPAFEPRPLNNLQIKSGVRHHLPDVKHKRGKSAKQQGNLTWEHAVTQLGPPLIFFFFFKSHYPKFGEMILADPGQTPACSLPNPTASPRLVVSPANHCQAVLTRPYLTHSWLPANVDRLLEGKPAAIWNITQALLSRPRSTRLVLPHIWPPVRAAPIPGRAMLSHVFSLEMLADSGTT